MATSALNREESLGLALAVMGHAALVAWLLLYRPTAPLPPPPERMEVTISDETGPLSTAPEPQAAPAPDKGPVIGEAMPPPSPEPQHVAKPAPTQPQVAAKPAPVQPKQTPRVAARPGASAFDRDFGAGIPSAAPGKAKNPPAAVASAQQRSSWTSQIGNKVKAHLRCGSSGLDSEKLFFNVTFTLKIDGSIQSIDEVAPGGTSPANQAQVTPMKACVIKAITLAAPFTGLPPEYYNDWKVRRMRLSLKEQ